MNNPEVDWVAAGPDSAAKNFRTSDVGGQGTTHDVVPSFVERRLAENWSGMLLRVQGEDGGFGAAPGLPSNTEATALAFLALGAAGGGEVADSRRRARDWLRTRQRPDGAWPLTEDVDQASWATTLALLALLDASPSESSPAGSGSLQRGGEWLVGRKGRRFSWRTTILNRLSGALELDGRLVGWPWHAESFSWVEPTALALLTLKRLRSHTNLPGADARIEAGERLLWDRMCKGGGWNYGNSVVLGEELEPYPDVTAIALIALQDAPGDPRVGRSLDALEHLLAADASGLALSWGALCFALHGRPLAELHARLVRRFEERSFLGETRTTALALLSLGAGAQAFRI